jgi:hypothetical protein
MAAPPKKAPSLLKQAFYIVLFLAFVWVMYHMAHSLAPIWMF